MGFGDLSIDVFLTGCNTEFANFDWSAGLYKKRSILKSQLINAACLLQPSVDQLCADVAMLASFDLVGVEGFCSDKLDEIQDCLADLIFPVVLWIRSLYELTVIYVLLLPEWILSSPGSRVW